MSERPLSPFLSLPRHGTDHDLLLQQMVAQARSDIPWREGRSWSLVYHADAEHSRFLARIIEAFLSENGLSPAAFPSLRHFENEVIGMLLHLLHAPPGATGSMTSGGTESTLLAIKAYRDWEREHRKGLLHPEMVLPETAHPAFFKAGAYFDVTPVVVPVEPDGTLDPQAMARAVTDHTILIGASAPSFTWGMVDPVSELGKIALDRGVRLHVDACLGGFFLPFMERLGYRVPPFDFRVPGVTSVATDLHKYGYAAKGASALLFCDDALRKKHYFVHQRPPWGPFVSPGMTGTRPGGMIAAAWGAMMALGEEGYLKLVRTTMQLTERLQSGISTIPGLKILGRPDMSVFSFTSETQDIFQVAQGLGREGWRMDRQHHPPGIHLIVTPNHVRSTEFFLTDLARTVYDIETGGDLPFEESRSDLLYGMTGEVVVTSDNLEQTLLDSMSRTYSPGVRHEEL